MNCGVLWMTDPFKGHQQRLCTMCPPMPPDPIKCESISGHNTTPIFISSNCSLSELDDSLTLGNAIHDEFLISIGRISKKSKSSTRIQRKPLHHLEHLLLSRRKISFLIIPPFSKSQMFSADFTAVKSACSSSVLRKDYSLPPSGYQPRGRCMTTTNTWAIQIICFQLLDRSGLGRWSGPYYLGREDKRTSILTPPPQQQKVATGSLSII